jgi:hypothetical protein
MTAACASPLTAADARPVPCAHLMEPYGPRAEPGCYLDLPITGCATCARYHAGRHETERTRCEVWTRVMGYHRPVSAFNDGKRAEHAERQLFSEQPTGAGRRRELPAGNRLRDQDGDWSTASYALPGREPGPAARLGEWSAHDGDDRG